MALTGIKTQLNRFSVRFRGADVHITFNVVFLDFVCCC